MNIAAIHALTGTILYFIIVVKALKCEFDSAMIFMGAMYSFVVLEFLRSHIKDGE